MFLGAVWSLLPEMYVYFSHYMVILFIYVKYRPETPPNTPQRARAAARQNERDHRHLDSPEHRRIPHNADPPPHIPPLNLPIPQPPPFPENMANLDDPFGPPPPPVQQYQNLPQHLAQQFQNLPALAPVRGRGRGRGHGHGHDPHNGIDHVSVKISIYLFLLIGTFISSHNIIICLLIWPNNCQLCQLCQLEEEEEGEGEREVFLLPCL